MPAAEFLGASLMPEKNRCPWCVNDPLYQAYHDNEWGVPVYDNQKLFEFLILEGAQAGLSWITILKKRENYRKAFAEFNPQKIVKFTPEKIETLLQNPGIIRNKLKVNTAVINAQAYLKLQDEGQELSEVLWQFVDGQPKINQFKSMSQIPAKTEISDQMSRYLKQRGFKFIGSTICYAFMQAVGMVNDHLTNCYRHPK